MLGEKKAQALAKQALSYSKADQTEVLVLGEDSALTRFANSYIHQNVHESNTTARVRVAIGKKIGVAATNDIGEAGLKRAVESATTIASLQQENPDFVSLPGPASAYAPATTFVEGTANVTPEQRARSVGVICKKCIAAGVTGSGALSTGVSEIAVANSLGTLAYVASTRADMSTVVMSDSGSGYSESASMDLRDIDFESVGDEAVHKALKSRNPVAIDPGEYTVILEEYAVADFLMFLNFLGFSATAVQEGRSFMKLGQKILGDNISIWDDGLDAAGLPMPFDYEGVAKRRLPLIEKGVARNVVYDSYSAGKEHKQSTGHALPAPNTMGPLASNMFMATGAHSKDEMLKSTKLGVWVTRFWYTRPIHPLNVIVTGTTRDGVFLIENGEITRPLRNFRFTQSYLDALTNVEMISSTAKTLTNRLGASRVPALKISSFNFTGVTQL